VNELPSKDILCGELFKGIISGNPIQARVIKQRPFTFRPSAGHIFAANALPGVNDETHGLWRRFAVITFNRRFEPTEMIRNLDQQIVSTERAGILNWMIAGALRLLAAGTYTIPKNSEVEKDLWKKQCDNVASFLADEMEIIAETREQTGLSFAAMGYTTATDAYRQYSRYCQDNGFQAGSSKKFSTRMKSAGLGSQEDRNGRWYPVRARKTEWEASAPSFTRAAPSEMRN
jgi:putative DNA primase/helicase